MLKRNHLLLWFACGALAAVVELLRIEASVMLWTGTPSKNVDTRFTWSVARLYVRHLLTTTCFGWVALSSELLSLLGEDKEQE